MIAQLNAFSEFQICSAERIYSERCRLSELRRQKWNSGKTKATWVHRREKQRQRTLENCRGIHLNIQQSTDEHMMRWNYPRPRRESLEGLEWASLSAHTRLGIVPATTSQVRKPHNSQGTGQGTPKSLASLMENNLPSAKHSPGRR